jgi:hypothetical protein
MKSIVLVLLALVLFHAVQADRVSTAKALLQKGGVYSKGCSEFISAILGIPWQSANDIMGSNPTYIGTNNEYLARPGDIIGWKSTTGSGHVAIYIGEPGMKIIDVPGPGKSPRALAYGYGAARVYRSSKY